MQRRPSARLLVLDPEGRVLLFRFTFSKGALQGTEFWGTPGGALEPGESFEDAAKRELLEETGIKIDLLGPVVAEREFPLCTPDGDTVMAEEKFYIVQVADQTFSKELWTEFEIEVMTMHKWWSIDEIVGSAEKIFPEDIAAILRSTANL